MNVLGLCHSRCLCTPSVSMHAYAWSLCGCICAWLGCLCVGTQVHHVSRMRACSWLSCTSQRMLSLRVSTSYMRSSRGLVYSFECAQLVCRQHILTLGCMHSAHRQVCMHERCRRPMCCGVPKAQLVCRYMALMHELPRNVCLPISSRLYARVASACLGFAAGVTAGL